MDLDTTSLNANLDPPVKHVQIVARDFRFTPNHIIAAPGSLLTVVFKNQGSHEHSIVFDLPGGPQGPRGAVVPDQSVRFVITLPASPGDYVFYCPIGDHRQRGMQGIVTVRG